MPQPQLQIPPRRTLPAALAPIAPLAPLTRAVCLALLTAGGLAATSATVLAQQGGSAETRLSFDIPAGALDDALGAFGAAAGVMVAADPRLTAGVRSPGVRGNYAVEDGLVRLLEGTPLQAVRQGPRAYALQARPPRGGETTLPAVTVTDTSLANASTLPETYAGGQTARGGRLGLLGNRDTLDAPFSLTQYTAKLIEDQQAQNIGDVLVNDPSVRNTYARGAGRDEFNIRGFTLFNYDVSYNGMYGASPRNASALIGIERVEVLRGPNAFLNGMAPYGSVGGSINLVPKRAGAEPLNRVTLSYIDDGQFGTHVDLGRRFGEAQELGLRVNAQHSEGDMPQDGAKEKLDAFSIGLDYHADRLRLEADLNYQNRLTHARSGLLFPPGSGVRIPSAPDARGNFFPDWTYWKTNEWFGVARAEYDLSPAWTAFAAVGGNRYDFSSLQTSWLMLDGQGTIGARPTRLKEEVNTVTGEAGVRGRFTTGELGHETVLSMSSFDLEHRQLRATSSIVLSDLYDPAALAEPAIAIGSHLPKVSVTRLRSLALADTISIADDRVQLMLGARQQVVVVDGFDGATGNRSAHYSKSALTPAVGITVKPAPALALYANYIEGLSQGPTAPSGAANAGEVFPPDISRQTEIGAKYDFGRIVATLSAFQIERPSSFLDPASQRFSTDGKQRNRGLELLAQGELAPGLRLLGGAAYTEAELLKTQSGANDGNTAPATPRRQANLALEWDTPLLPGLTLTARALHTGGQYVDAANTQKLPAWNRYDLGARYAFTAAGKAVVLRGTVENVTDKDYWLSAAREGLTVGAPRTLLLSLSVDL